MASVLAQPDRPAGRGLRATPGAVKRFALERGLEVFQPARLKAPEVLAHIAALRPDAFVVAAYGMLIPQTLLDAARRGAFNIHASLLPRWRGAAPIQHALLAGDRETGVSIMKMDAGLDTGPLLARRRIPIEGDDDAGTLHDKLAELGAQMIVIALADVERGHAVATAQPEQGVTYAPKIQKAETRLDWSRGAAELERAVRAFRPAPGAFTLLEGEPLKVWRAAVHSGEGAPATVLASAKNLLVACGEDALELIELQRPGSRRLSAGDFLRGKPLAPGTRFA